MTTYLNMTGHPLKAELLPEGSTIIAEPVVGRHYPLEAGDEALAAVLTDYMKGHVPEELGTEMPILVINGPCTELICAVFEGLSGRKPIVCKPHIQNKEDPYGVNRDLQVFRNVSRTARTV